MMEQTQKKVSKDLDLEENSDSHPAKRSKLEDRKVVIVFILSELYEIHLSVIGHLVIYRTNHVRKQQISVM